RALALAATLGHVGLQAPAQYGLGVAYYDAGDYARAVESLGWNVATLRGDLLAERAGSMHPVAVASWSWLSRGHAERGAFIEGRANAPCRRSTSPASISNAARRPGLCGSWARVRRARYPPRSSQPPVTTVRPSPWPQPSTYTATWR